ncbi:sigma-70 family RNA polymerase sigma factor [Oxalicibacterium faecigallinarum]|uniref:ECF sigma factor FemI n=1 Tax=Oxalicibacterium faecigallinarum TaxID=573741 RepID=A0A8J3AXD9_9BURK|nr:sigma-70 family RNA polymerase sigma factor [Oxalicibacterium faecigallinarum]GGI18596.1 ECF sigma factor FemI [Oxalicibacterium faecigallinarum]
MTTSATHGNELAALYSAHHGWLRTWLQRKLGCSFDAADLAQDTFVRVASCERQENAMQLREPRAYLTTIAKGLMVDMFRRRSLEQAWADALASLPENTAISPEERLLILEALQKLDSLLDALPEKVRAVFLMSQLDGMTYTDIAGQMNLSLRTVKRYMQQGFVQCLTLML